MSFASATPTIGLPSKEPIIAIETNNIDLFTMDFKSQLEAKDEVITCFQEDVQNLLHETKEKSLVVTKHVEEIQDLRWIGSHALVVDDI